MLSRPHPHPRLRLPHLSCLICLRLLSPCHVSLASHLLCLLYLSSPSPPSPLVLVVSRLISPRLPSLLLSLPSRLSRALSPSCLISLAPCLSSPPLSCVSSRLYLLFTLQAVAHSSGWWSPSGLAIIICTMHPCSTTRAVNWGWVPSVAHVFGVLGWYGCCWWCWRGIAWVPVITPCHYLLWAASESVVYTPVCFGVWGGYCDMT